MEAFCTHFCPFRSPSSSFTSKSLQNWTRNVSRNVSESGWKRSNRRGRKPPVRPREPRVTAVSDFPGTAGRVPTGSKKTGRCAAVRENRKFDRSPAQQVRSKEEMQRNGRDLPHLRQTLEHAETGKIEGFWTLRRESRIKGWRRNQRFSCSQQPAVRTVSGGCAGAAIGACLEKNKRGWRQKSHKCRRFKGFRRATPQIGGL